ncbi:MAG: 1-(5-phosphoribosyl)-5-((5-phosphoribosylamino)methylideneamino)imidazole-4-carboxamide isomerase, partial [Acetobacteraceae bacterium]|nr:1-(5-phosphoribosyl)-5-((5-phosphoribosylamino)methylideneamino)imidazole-4-carboxamide isomerase [Acetobacteraceae bacterium]
SILAAARVPVQLGGGIRDMAGIERWLGVGVRRAILGSAAVKTPDLVRQACRAFPSRVAVGIDAREGVVATDGWSKSAGVSALELALRFEDAGVAAIIYTDIGRDGMLAGVNIKATLALATRLQTQVIASGGVSSIEDLRELRDAAWAAQARVEGVIVGRALYDGRIALADALAALREAPVGSR